MNVIEELRQRFAACGQVRFTELADGIVAAEVRNAASAATVSLYGGQVLEWHPGHQSTPVLWLSPRVKYRPGKAIRGGVPMCWPWFGSHPTQAVAPGHGYARVATWDVSSIRALPSGDTQIDLDLPSSDAARAHGYPGLQLSARITIGRALTIELTTTNRGDRPVTYTEGLHTYFRVGDVSRIRIRGLEGAEYADLLDGNARKRQTGPITFEGELGRVYVDTEATCVIEDELLGRRIVVRKQGSRSTAVWNPWTAMAANMDDLGADGWRDMVCVETANALADAITLDGGSSHGMSATYSAEDIAPVMKSVA
jgi:D-hexose-6-phosphate mutarotase